jgi:hypothetical protein
MNHVFTALRERLRRRLRRRLREPALLGTRCGARKTGADGSGRWKRMGHRLVIVDYDYNI